MKCSWDALVSMKNFISAQGKDFQAKSFQFERKAPDLNKLKFDSEKLDAKSFCNFSTNSKVNSS